MANFEEDGYLLLDLEMTQAEIDKINAEVDAYAHSEGRKSQEEGYTYSSSARLFEAWRTCPSVCALACHPRVIKEVRKAMSDQTNDKWEDVAAIPFQTINFQAGSNQPLHSDLIHFQSIPENLMLGAWVALEDMDADNGALRVVPGSHKWPVVDLQDLGFPLQEYGKQFDAYRVYEQHTVDLVASKKAEIREINCKAGTAILWAANLLHGGSPIKDFKRTRKSQATHYYFGGCKYYSPMFSDTKNGVFAWKDLSGKNILGQHAESLKDLTTGHS